MHDKDRNIIPESLQTQILNFTGTKERGNTGFLLIFIDKEGKIRCLERTDYPYMRDIMISAAERYYKENQFVLE